MKRTVSISPAQWRALGSGDDPISQDVVIAIDGSLSVDRLEEALALMIGRHEPLRTCYPVGDGDVLVQEIWDEFRPALARLDLTTATSD